MKKILILFGGNSYEHEISCKSAKTILENIDKTKFTVTSVGIHNNSWYIFNDNLDLLNNNKWLEGNIKKIDNIIEFLKTFDTVFPIIHGNNGETGDLSGLFNLFNIPYISSDIKGHNLAYDKHLTKIICSNYNIPQIPYTIIESNKKIKKINIDFPVIIKPSSCGSSIGINIANNYKELNKYVKAAFNYDNKVIIEKYIKVRELECAILENKNKLNVLIIHGTIDGASIEEKQYNSMSKKMLKEKGFDYIALGHIHKKDYNTEENQKIVYSGSTASLGFDELGEHGMIVGNLDKDNLELGFIPLDEEEFIEINLDITNLYSVEELIEKINLLEIKENQYVKIILIGNRNFEINIYEILKFIENNKIIKIKNKTKLGYDLEKIINETTLKGLFAKEMKEKLNLAENEEEKEIIEKAIEIGLEALE